MPLKILTGQIVPNASSRTKGTAVIDFNEHRVDGNAEGGSMKTIGSGSYPARNPPGFLLALRDFVAQDRRRRDEDRTEQDRFRVDTTEYDANHLEVEWECEPGAQIIEISYLVVGEV